MHFCDNLQTYVHLWFHYGKLPAGTNACMTATMLMKLNHFRIYQGFSVCESKLQHACWMAMRRRPSSQIS